MALCFKKAEKVNVFAEVELRCNNGTKHLMVQINKFCNHSTNWSYKKAHRNISSKNDSHSKVCDLIYSNSNWNPRFPFYEKKDGHIYMTNILSETGKNIPVPGYNSLAKSFQDDFMKWNINQRNGIRVSISKTDLELEDIITAKIPRKHFQSFMHGSHPFNYHPSEIEMLDRFICSVARYSRKSINWEYLDEYLIKKKAWTKQNVSWCLCRIKTGLDIIRIYKRYRYIEKDLGHLTY